MIDVASPDRVDVLVVGARCAGASVAAHVARAGASVTLLDASALPSDQPMSTHLIQPPGMAELDRLGVGARVRQLCPALTSARFSFDDRQMVLRYDEGAAAHCLSREKLDVLLQDAAVAAGADLQPESRVVGLLRDSNARVCGAEVRRKNGRLDRLYARLVVGADGRGSTVARLAGAAEYLGYDGPRASVWAYWKRPPGADPATLVNVSDRDRSHVWFPTDDDRILIASAPPASHLARWRGDHAAAYLADVRECTPLARLLGDATPLGRVRVFSKARYFFRVSAGPGWALAGDAGHHKEFVIGLGISDALRDGSRLASAIIEGGDTALERYWRERDVARIELYRWGQELGLDDRVNALERLVATRVAAAPELAGRFSAVLSGELPPHELVPARRVLAWLIAALMSGDPWPVVPMIAALRRTFRGRKERRERENMAASVREPRPPKVIGHVGSDLRGMDQADGIEPA